MNTNYWNQTPLLRLLPAFLAGILFAIYVPGINLALLLCMGAIPFLAVCFQYYFPKQFYSYRRRWLFGLSSHCLMFLAGSILTIINTETNYPEHFSHYKGKQYIGFISEPLNEKAKSFRTAIKITSVKTTDGWESSTGNCLAYIAKDSTSAKLRYGDLIIFSGQPAEVMPPSNPSQFDYKRWLSFNKIYHQVYIADSQWALLGHDYGNTVIDYSFELRDKLLAVFRQNNIRGQDYAVLSALILGDEAEIDQETINAYQASGALHVLSVSGMHVGIIYLAINLLLGFLDKKRWTKILKAIIIVLFLWFYAVLTGLSPAVLRSAAMLSFVVLGTLKKAPTNMYNTLIASAIFLLSFNPYLIMQVGFQLSYLAVIGIVFLQKKIHAWYDAPNWFLGKTWDIISVSIAAQMATFPLGLLYFHQFPNYFLFSNLIIIPLSTIIIYGGICLLLSAPIASLAHIIGLILGELVHFLNDIVLSIEHLPYSLIKGISISVFDTWLIYILILSIVFYLMKKDPRLILASLLIIILLLASQISESIQLRNQRMITIYNIPKKSAITFIENKQCVFLADSDLVNNKA